MHCVSFALLLSLCLLSKTFADEFEGQDELQPTTTKGLLYPFETETREVRSLDGIWRFLKSSIWQPMQGVEEGWYKQDLDKVRATIPMPVPASYNDLTTEQELRDHVGTVWYERKFYAPKLWRDAAQRVWLRFGSVHYSAIVWLNGQQLLQHNIGHLPFETEVGAHLLYGAKNRLTLMCDNRLSNITIPEGEVLQEPFENSTTLLQSYTFDFFNYAGIHRSVHLYTTPMLHIQDVNITTDLQSRSIGLLHYDIAISNHSSTQLSVNIYLRDHNKDVVAKSQTHLRHRGVLKIPNVRAWWPYLMHPEPGYLYELEVTLHNNQELLDVYRMKVGIRKLRWSNDTLTLNDSPLYLRGFGRHEDMELRGKGLDLALLTRDFNLIKWIGANAYRTSHYPYSEESMQFADEHGIMIIDECPAVNIDHYSAALLKTHKSSLEQLIHRDRNHASVIMWSIANEPRSNKEQAEAYFGNLTLYTRQLDATRPITASINVEVDKDKLAKFLDIISFNRYNAWYHNTGQLGVITKAVIEEAEGWRKQHNKPVLMSEYGADTLEGLHALPEFVWSEDFQSALFAKHFKAFDVLRHQKWFIGEFVWNFADFKTEQAYTRAGGNRKGIFTRQRQPKTAAHLLRQRYYALALELDQCIVPDDVFPYLSSWTRE